MLSEYHQRLRQELREAAVWVGNSTVESLLNQAAAAMTDIDRQLNAAAHAAVKHERDRMQEVLGRVRAITEAASGD